MGMRRPAGDTPCGEPGLVTLCTMHLLRAIPECREVSEFYRGPDYYPWQDGLFLGDPSDRDGHATVTDAPGWGVEISPAGLARARHRVSGRQ